MKQITVIIIGAVILLIIGAGLILKEAQKPTGTSGTEKQKIDVWIKENDLNQYGDPKNIFYTGGTPLFDEKTGRSIDKYEYILKNHPDQPWLK